MMWPLVTSLQLTFFGFLTTALLFRFTTCRKIMHNGQTRDFVLHGCIRYCIGIKQVSWVFPQRRCHLVLRFPDRDQFSENNILPETTPKEESPWDSLLEYLPNLASCFVLLLHHRAIIEGNHPWSKTLTHDDCNVARTQASQLVLI